MSGAQVLGACWSVQAEHGRMLRNGLKPRRFEAVEFSPLEMLEIPK